MKQEVHNISLKYLFFTFLKIGAISWGGFMALIAVVQKQLVDKDQVIREEVILDGISLASACREQWPSTWLPMSAISCMVSKEPL